ncbi:MAG TPA: molybdenum ABC transporter ATP-binding protein [Rhizomicrobium sp.]|nr:molybdenum ABC transporter ATP-binding protein [Rhizomicrobium sp.]
MSIDIGFAHRYRAFALEVAFQAQNTGITALFGPSGAGKTTVIDALAGLIRPERGRIAVNGRVLFDSHTGTWIPAHARRAGYVFQDGRLFPHLSVEANLRFGWRRAAVALPEADVSRIVAMLGLESLLARKPAQLSGGERARVAIGRALLASPEFLLLDEPLAALDAARKQEIFPYLERLRDEQRLPIVYVSHSLDEVARLADTIVLLGAGRVLASGPLFDLLTDLRFGELSGGSPYGTVLEARVARHLVEHGLSLLAFAGGELAVATLSRAEGSRVRMHIRAEDIILARERPRAISANNILPATIVALRDSTPQHVDVRLGCGQTHFVARITRASCKRLELCEGQNVFAIVKSVTITPAGNG